MTDNNKSFYGLGIAPNILEILEKLRFTIPTPIQHKAIPIAIEGKDVIGIAQTGTGKTLAFAIPMIQRLANMRGRGLVLVPTRELAFQVNEAIVNFTAPLGMKTSVLIGGEPAGKQIDSLRKNPRIITATPGRLNDHLNQQRLRIDDVHTLILDEADRMLDMGFMPQIEKIIRLIPRDRQTMLFSATMPPKILKIASSYMQLPISTEIAPTGTTAEGISQELFVVKKEFKLKLLDKILQQYRGPILMFTRTKRGAKKVTGLIRNMRYAAAEIHADRSLGQRKEALEGFKSGRYRILVATDIAARGIDVSGIEVVINFDLPDDPENYVHRIGRTGRAGNEGHAISFVTPEQKKDVLNIESIIRSAIPHSKHPDVPSENYHAMSSHSPQPQYRRGGQGQRQGQGQQRQGQGQGPKHVSIKRPSSFKPRRTRR